MDNFPWLDVLITVWACGAAVTDYRQRRLPNSLTLGAAVAAIAYLLICNNSLLGASPLSATVAGTGAILVLAPCYWLGWLGAGDIKLMSAIGFIGGIETLATTFVFSSLLTLPVALWLSLIKRKRPSSSETLRLPQGVFLALGLIISMISGVQPDSI